MTPPLCPRKTLEEVNDFSLSWKSLVKGYGLNLIGKRKHSCDKWRSCKCSMNPGTAGRSPESHLIWLGQWAPDDALVVFNTGEYGSRNVIWMGEMTPHTASHRQVRYKSGYSISETTNGDLPFVMLHRALVSWTVNPEKWSYFRWAFSSWNVLNSVIRPLWKTSACSGTWVTKVANSPA